MTKEELQKEFKATHIPQLGENFWFAYATWLEEQVIKALEPPPCQQEKEK